ncbi:MAG: GMC oxidoreductase, partial [Gammaproteobacteria bacterium]|nr:GMC oxidoreductase [Gammaproteobacteria bacterium]
SPLPRMLANWTARHALGWYAITEDLPATANRVTVDRAAIRIAYRRTNWRAHRLLVARAKSVFRRAGFPLTLSRAFDFRTPSHQCGTTRFGDDPESSVLDTFCRAHDHPNLFVVDAGFMPSSAAVNPALTIAAQALRAGDHLRARLEAGGAP